MHLVGRPVDKEDRVTPCKLLSRSVPTASASTEAAHARITEAWQTRLELIQHATERRMLPVLDLNPAIEPAGALTAVVVFRNQAFVPHQECGVGFRQLRTCRRTCPGQLCARSRPSADQAGRAGIVN